MYTVLDLHYIKLKLFNNKLISSSLLKKKTMYISKTKKDITNVLNSCDVYYTTKDTKDVLIERLIMLVNSIEKDVFKQYLKDVDKKAQNSATIRCLN